MCTENPAFDAGLCFFMVAMLLSGHELTVLTEEEQNEEYRVKIEKIFEILLENGAAVSSLLWDRYFSKNDRAGEGKSHEISECQPVLCGFPGIRF